MTHLKLQVGDVEDGSSGGEGSLDWVTMKLSVAEFKNLTVDELMDRHMRPAMQQLIWKAKERLGP